MVLAGVLIIGFPLLFVDVSVTLPFRPEVPVELRPLSGLPAVLMAALLRSPRLWTLEVQGTRESLVRLQIWGLMVLLCLLAAVVSYLAVPSIDLAGQQLRNSLGYFAATILLASLIPADLALVLMVSAVIAVLLLGHTPDHGVAGWALPLHGVGSISALLVGVVLLAAALVSDCAGQIVFVRLPGGRQANE